MLLHPNHVQHRFLGQETYYFIPEIYDAYGKEYHTKKNYMLGDIDIDWMMFVAGLDLGVLPYTPEVNMHGARSDYFRIVDTHKFLLTSIRLGVIIDAKTPVISQVLDEETTYTGACTTTSH